VITGPPGQAAVVVALQCNPNCRAKKDRVRVDVGCRVVQIGFVIETVVTGYIKEQAGQNFQVEPGAQGEKGLVGKRTVAIDNADAGPGVDGFANQEYSFLLEAESTRGPQCGLKNFVNKKFQ
jgi:hypothetical protein